MGKKSYITRLVNQVELVEIEYPEDLGQDKVAEYEQVIAEGVYLDDLPDDVSFSVVYNIEMVGGRLEDWESESEYMPIAEDMITTVKEYKYDFDQFMWHLEFLTAEEYFKFITYLVLKGYEGDEEEMLEKFHKKYFK